jgi:uncharacterized SAM-binding protein YcdF (DUF218 family)
MNFFRRVLPRIVRVGLVMGLIWLLFTIALMVYVHAWGIAQQPNSQADMIIVLGAGVDPNGTAGFALTRRTRLGAELYAQGSAPLVMCTGAIPYNRPVSEASACREVLLTNGVPTDAILLEERSRSTEENALYAKEILTQNNLNSAIVVTDSFHAFRSRFLFEAMGINVSMAVVPPNSIRNPVTYLMSLMRESVALQWQVFKDAFGIRATHVPLL